MAAPAKMRIRSEKHLSNITKRGKVNTDKDDQDGYTVGPLVLGFFLFVILGSAVLQLIQAAQGSGM